MWRQYKGNKILESRTVVLGTPEADGLGVFRGMDAAAAHKALTVHRADGKAAYHDKRRARLAAKAAAREAAQSAWLPAHLVEAFELERLPALSARKDRWLIVKELLAETDVPPYLWHGRPEIFWKRFREKKWSAGYVRRLVAYINAWGEFYCQKTGKPWRALPKLKGAAREQLQREHFLKRPRHTAELTADDLAAAVVRLTPAEANALRIGFWLGLRPEELAQVIAAPASPDSWYVDMDRRGFQVFHLFQDKLRRKGVEPRLCWKAVPLVEPEQEELVPLLEAHAPLAPVPIARLRRDLGLALTRRSLRKGFSVEMEERGYERALIDDWLGHIGRTTGALSYRSRRRAVYAPPAVWASKRKG